MGSGGWIFSTSLHFSNSQLSLMLQLQLFPHTNAHVLKVKLVWSGSCPTLTWGLHSQWGLVHHRCIFSFPILYSPGRLSPGFSPRLAEFELVDDPSCAWPTSSSLIMRLQWILTTKSCGLSWTLSFLFHILTVSIKNFVQPHLHGWVITADVKARLKYWEQLSVYGKDCVHMSAWMSKLLTEFEDGVKVSPSPILLGATCY